MLSFLPANPYIHLFGREVLFCQLEVVPKVASASGVQFAGISSMQKKSYDGQWGSPCFRSVVRSFVRPNFSAAGRMGPGGAYIYIYVGYVWPLR